MSGSCHGSLPLRITLPIKASDVLHRYGQLVSCLVTWIHGLTLEPPFSMATVYRLQRGPCQLGMMCQPYLMMAPLRSHFLQNTSITYLSDINLLFFESLQSVKARNECLDGFLSAESIFYPHLCHHNTRLG